MHSDNNGSMNQRYTKPSRNLSWIRDPLARDRTTTFPPAVNQDSAARSSATNPAARHSYRYDVRESPQYGSRPVYSQNAYGAHGVPSYGHGTHLHHPPGFQAHYPHNSRDRYPPSYGSRDYYPPPYGSRDYYPPSNGSRDYYPPSHGIRDYYPPSHGIRDYHPPSHGHGTRNYPSPSPSTRNYHPPSPSTRNYHSPSHVSSPHYPLQRIGASGPRSYGVRDPGHLSSSQGVAAGTYPSHGKGVHRFPSSETGAVVPCPKFPAVSLRGLPINCTEVDIFQFFDGLDIVDVFLVFNNKIFSRTAFVILSNAVAVGSALQRDKQKLGDSFVDISTCRRRDYYDAVAAAVTEGMFFGNRLEGNDNNLVNDVNHHEGAHDQAARFRDSSVVRNRDTIVDSKLHSQHDVQLGNLLDRDQGKPTHHILKVRVGPCSVDKKVILGVFGECNLSEDRVHTVFHPDGKPTGEMLLEFISQEDAKKAMSMDKTMIESHLIEIVPCLEDLQFTNTKQRQERDSQDTEKNSNDKELMGPDAHSYSKPSTYSDKKQKVYTKILKLCNVPPSADMYDIIDFFSEFSLTLERLKVVCRRDGIATGDVYVEFDSVEDAEKAITKDVRMILSQCVELFPSSPNEASQSMSRSW